MKSDNFVKTLADRRGFGLIEAMIAFALLSLAGLASTAYFQNVAKAEARQSFVNSMLQVKMMFQSTINDPAAWAKTIQNSPPGPGSLSCISAGSCLQVTDFMPLTLLNADGSMSHSTRPIPPMASPIRALHAPASWPPEMMAALCGSI